jgi:adenosylcobinamide kinase/adenosylcobinamide-phosphate guanylyltransferase
MSRFALVGGGASSGKTAFALKLAMRRGERRVFVATAEAFDDEMRERIARHVAERGRDFETLEAPRDLERALARLGAERRDIDVVVIDCLTLWLSNLMLAELTQDAIAARVDALASVLSSYPFDTILVTNEVGMGLVPETPLGRAFRDVAGRAHQRLASTADEVFLAALGTVLRLRPGPVIAVELSEPRRAHAMEHA